MLKFLTAFFVAMISLLPVARAEDIPLPPVRPHLLLDTASGEVLTQELAFTRWAPASLTKMMTAYTVFRTLELQHLKMDSPVRVSEEAISQPPSKMGFPVGTILNIETALKIIMVKSANDIAVALAESTSGSEEQFVALMNSHARRLGMSDSHFINPHGLHDEMQYTSARDMALLAMALTKEFPQYERFFDIPAIRFGRGRLRNHNALLRLFDGTNGMKTGYVCASGYNVVVRTQRKGRQLIAVVLGGSSGLARNVKAAELLSDGFKTKPGDDGNTIFTMPKPANVSDELVDITKERCPRKYAAQGKPNVRPPEAPKTQDFDGIDTIVLAQREEREKAPYRNLPTPKKRPEYEFVATLNVGVTPLGANVAAVDSKVNPGEEAKKDDVDEAVEKNKPPNLRELAKIHLQPVSSLREDVRIQLGGGTGPNPHGIKHTNGGVYEFPIPVPIKRPALDLAASKE